MKIQETTRASGLGLENCPRMGSSPYNEFDLDKQCVPATNVQS